MIVVERTTALRLTDMARTPDGGWQSKQYQPLEESGYNGIQDNGGEPDGNAWLIWPVNRLSEDVKEAIALGAELVAGFEAEYRGREWNEYMDGHLTSGDEWSGVQSAETAFFTNERNARLCAAFSHFLDETDDPTEAQILANGDVVVEVR